MNIERLKNDSDYFEECKLEIAERAMKEAETDMPFFVALSLAEDELMVTMYG